MLQYLAKCTNDNVTLMSFFGGAIGNMTHIDRTMRIGSIDTKCSKDIDKQFLKNVVSAQGCGDVVSAYLSIIEFTVGENHTLAETRYLSPYIAEKVISGACAKLNYTRSKM